FAFNFASLRETFYQVPISKGLVSLGLAVNYHSRKCVVVAKAIGSGFLHTTNLSPLPIQILKFKIPSWSITSAPISNCCFLLFLYFLSYLSLFRKSHLQH